MVVRKGSDPEVGEDLDGVFFEESVGVLLGRWRVRLWWVEAVVVSGGVGE